MDRMDKSADRLEGKLKEIDSVADYHERGIRFYYEAAPLMQDVYKRQGCGFTKSPT